MVTLLHGLAQLLVLAELASLAEAHRAKIALVRLLARVRVLMILPVLWQTELFGTKATL